MNSEPVGVIGLGNMGRGIARNLAATGVSVLGWDISTEACASATETIGIEVSRPASMAAKCTVVFFVVPGTAEIEACLRDGDGLLERAATGLVVYDCTTSNPVATRELAARAASCEVTYLDAGMSGGAAGADTGSLTLMIGGDRAAFERTSTLLDAIADRIFYLGDSGSGHTMKLIHNLVCHTIFLATCEGGRMAERSGIDLADMIDVFNASNARSYASEVRFPKHILSETWDARSHVSNLHKDVAMAVDLAQSLESPVPLGTVTRGLLDAAIAHGMANADFSRLYQIFAEIDATLDEKSASTKR